MRVCIDTNAYSALLQNRAGLQILLEQADLIYVPTIVLGELYAGFRLGSRNEQNLRQLQAFLDMPGVRTTPAGEAVALRYGYLVCDLRQQGTPIPTNDLWIAATALETGARLVSYDAHFECVPGLIVLAP